MKALPLVFAACLIGSPAMAADITIMSGGAPKEALAVLVPRFEQQTGHRVKITYMVISALRQKLNEGATPDMVLMPTTAIAELSTSGQLKADGSAPFGAVKIVAIVRNGAQRPDITTVPAFRETLLKATSIVYSTPTATPSGAHMAHVVAQLGITDTVEKKVTYRPALEGGVEMVADGKAEIGIYPSSEVVHVAGVTVAGPLPDALQLDLTYGGAVTAANSDPDPALSLIKFLSGKDNAAVWTATGFDPPRN